MPPTKDHYRTLGVAETASADEIKKAYRKLAKRYHPDVTGGDKAKEAKFKEVSEAYETLGEDKKRAQYDAARKNPFASGGGFDAGFPGGFPAGFPGPSSRARRGTSRVDMHDIDDLFGGANKGAGAGGAGGAGFYQMFSDLFSDRTAEPKARTAPRGESVHARVEVDLPTAAIGGELALTVDGKRLTVKVPPGIEDGQTIRIAGQGQHGQTGTGDLLLDVHVRPHARFRRKGHDLEVDVPVPVDEAILGAKVEVLTLEGPAKLTLPPGSSSGLKLRLRGKGARKPGSPERGDLYAVVQIVVPKEVPAKARELLEEFARLTRGAK